MSLFGAESNFEDQDLEPGSGFWKEFIDLNRNASFESWLSEPVGLAFDAQTADINDILANENGSNPLILQYSLQTTLHTTPPLAATTSMAAEHIIKTEPRKVVKVDSASAEILIPEAPLATATASKQATKREKRSQTTMDSTTLLTEESIQAKIDSLEQDLEENDKNSKSEMVNANNAKAQRLIKNKFSAARSRILAKISKLEDKMLIFQLKGKIHALEQEKAELVAENQGLQLENMHLKAREEREERSKTLQFSSHTALRLSQDLSPGQHVVITTTHELQASPSKRNKTPR